MKQIVPTVSQPLPTVSNTVKHLQESYLFYMPEDAEAFLCALASVQGLVASVRKENIDPIVRLDCPNPQTHFLLKALEPSPGKLYTAIVVALGDNEQLASRDFDLAFKFDLAAAMEMGSCTNKHLSQMFSIQLGSPPELDLIVDGVEQLVNFYLPHLDFLQLPNVCDVLLLPWPGTGVLAELLSMNKPDSVVVLVDAEKELSLEDMLVCVAKSKIVVGIRGPETLVAAALGKGVIEISPPSRGYRGLLSKWSCPGYRMVYSEVEQVTAPLIYRSLEALWRRFVDRDKSTQMAQQI